MKTRDAQRGRRLTKEQEELRQHGLRLLARIIVRRHLASLAHEGGCATPVADGSSVSPRASGEESPIEAEDEHAR
ncbi:MAG: hypothetical protein F4X54_07675 [Chloroflexi bacterium]|nr:hypothetical protein [Chloroflexota bacterium]MYB84597.1 hypothetical protein [Chloroflexota bacterium]